MTPGWGPVLAKGSLFVNKLSRGILGDATKLNINAQCLVVSDKKIFPIDSYSESVSSQWGPLNSSCAPY